MPCVLAILFILSQTLHVFTFKGTHYHQSTTNNQPTPPPVRPHFRTYILSSHPARMGRNPPQRHARHTAAPQRLQPTRTASSSSYRITFLWPSSQHSRLIHILPPFLWRTRHSIAIIRRILVLILTGRQQGANRHCGSSTTHKLYEFQQFAYAVSHQLVTGRVRGANP